MNNTERARGVPAPSQRSYCSCGHRRNAATVRAGTIATQLLFARAPSQPPRTVRHAPTSGPKQSGRSQLKVTSSDGSLRPWKSALTAGRPGGSLDSPARSEPVRARSAQGYEQRRLAANLEIRADSGACGCCGQQLHRWLVPLVPVSPRSVCLASLSSSSTGRRSTGCGSAYAHHQVDAWLIEADRELARLST